MLRVACPRENAGGSDRFPTLLQTSELRASGPGSDGPRPPPPGLREPARLVFCYEVPTRIKHALLHCKILPRHVRRRRGFIRSYQPRDVGSDIREPARSAAFRIRNREHQVKSQLRRGRRGGPTAKSVRSDRLAARNCSSLARAAAVHELPLAFFTRLIRQESNFDSRQSASGGTRHRPVHACDGTLARLVRSFEPLRRCWSPRVGCTSCRRSLEILG